MRNFKRSQMNQSKCSHIIQNIALTVIAATILSGCGGTSQNTSSSPGSNQLMIVAPNILPSLANEVGVNYAVIYNPSNAMISGITYNLGQQVGSGNSVTMDPISTVACANIAARSGCYLKFLVPESAVSGGVAVSATNSNGTEAAASTVIGVQQILYNESESADGVGLYFYPKVQYNESGAQFILVTAVVQSANAGTINTVELVDESGNVIPNQVVISNNSGSGSETLTMGDVVDIALPIPQGVDLTQYFKVQTSYQTPTTETVSSIIEKLNFKDQALKTTTTNSSTGTSTYSLTTQGNNINLQLVSDQVYLTASNPYQDGYLYNNGNQDATNVTIVSDSSNVRVTLLDTMILANSYAKVSYELIDTSSSQTSNQILVTGLNPMGQTQTVTAIVSQNINPDVVPTPIPSPSPSRSPSPSPSPAPAPGPPPVPVYAYIVNSNNNSYTQCSVGASGIDASTCTTTTPGSLLSSPLGIAFNGSYAYIVNGNDNSYTQCSVGASGIEPLTCQTIAPSISGNNVLNIPAGIAFNGSYAYITNYSDNSYAQCSVGVTGLIDASTCFATIPTISSNNVLDSPYGIAVNGNYVYIVNNGGSNSYTQCGIGVSGIDASTCQTIAPSVSGGHLNGPVEIAFNGNYAYIVNSGNNSYTQCSVGTSGIDASTCTTTTPGSLLSSPLGIAFNGSYVYIVNSGNNSYTQCRVGVSGIDSSSCITTIPTSTGALSTPVGIAFD